MRLGFLNLSSAGLFPRNEFTGPRADRAVSMRAGSSGTASSEEVAAGGDAQRVDRDAEVI